MENENVKIMIWGKQIPYNTGESKIKVMALKKKPGFDVFWKFVRVVGKNFIDDPDAVNGVTYLNEIKKNGAKETFDDAPYLMPFLASGRDRAVIIVPGGGYAMQSTEDEGIRIARSLNEEDISAFVLWYRLNPYRAPVPFLDLQRAVRYVKYHAADYGIDPRKVGVLGFSAGGHACAALVNILRNAPVDAPGYTLDEIDQIDDRPALAGLIYPVIDLSYNPGILFALAEPEAVRDETSRRALIARYNSAHYIQPGDPPQFLCYGTKDLLVDPKGVLAYKAILDEKGVENQLLAIEGANHGFGSCEGNFAIKLMNGRYAFWKKAFADWANGIFERIDAR